MQKKEQNGKTNNRIKKKLGLKSILKDRKIRSKNPKYVQESVEDVGRIRAYMMQKNERTFKGKVRKQVVTKKGEMCLDVE